MFNYALKHECNRWTQTSTMHQKMFSKRRVFQACFIIVYMLTPIVFASEQSLIAELHKQPPASCISKAIEDTSSGIAIAPDGVTREDVIDHMGAFASFVLSTGANNMTSKHIDTVYTAVFYEKEPINEVGIYGYRFKEPINSEMFVAKPELNGRLLIINNRLLVLLWHEDIRKTGLCYSAMEKTLLKYVH